MPEPSTLYQEKQTLVEMVTALRFTVANHEKKQIAIMSYINHLQFVPPAVKNLILDEITTIILKDEPSRTSGEICPSPEAMPIGAGNHDERK